MYLLNILPFAVFPKVPDLAVTDYWKMLIILRRTCTLLTGLQISVNQLSILNYLIEEYLEYRATVFKDVPLKPKHHYLLHYPYLTLNFGPLRHLWTLRFEAKHSYFKNCVRHSQNFKNILFSLTNKHQQLQCLHELEENVYNDNPILKDATVYRSLLFNDNDLRYESKELEYRGITYKVGMYLCAHDNSEYNSYIVCKIETIVLNKTINKVYFCGATFEIAFDSDSGLYYKMSDNQDSPFFFDYDKLANVEPLIHSRILDQDLFYFKSAALEFL